MDDAAGFSAFVAARGPALLRLGWLLTGDADAAEDLAQEALARFVRHWDRVSRDGSPEAYVRQSMRAIWIDSWRRRHGWTVTPTDAVPDAGATDGGIDAVGSRQAVAQALAALAPRQRAVVVLRFVEDLTETQTARALGCSTSTVKSQTREALANLRRLAPWLADELDGAEDRAASDAGPPGVARPAARPASRRAEEVPR